MDLNWGEHELLPFQGRIQDFHWGGGGRPRMPRARSPVQSPFTAGMAGVLEALGGFDALSFYMSLILKHSDTGI